MMEHPGWCAHPDDTRTRTTTSNIEPSQVARVSPTATIELQRRQVMQYSFLKSIWKAVKAVGILAGVAGATALLSLDFAQSIADQPGAAILIPMIQALAVVAIDFLKHRD